MLVTALLKEMNIGTQVGVWSSSAGMITNTCCLGSLKDAHRLQHRLAGLILKALDRAGIADAWEDQRMQERCTSDLLDSFWKLWNRLELLKPIRSAFLRYF